LALPLVFTVLGSAWLALLSALGAAPEEQRLLEQISAAPGGLALAAGAYAVIGAPVAEELLFRGAMYAYVAERRGGVAASAVTGALFGLLHIADPAAVPPLMVMGVMLGELRRRGASLWPCIAAHALNNVLAVLLAMA
jgi:membrane protease YdiL (CAAX protease family)